MYNFFSVIEFEIIFENHYLKKQNLAKIKTSVIPYTVEENMAILQLGMVTDFVVIFTLKVM